MDASDIKRKGLDYQETLVFNPLIRDFTWNCNGKPYTVLTLETKKFPKHIGDLIGKHIIDGYFADEKFISVNKRKQIEAMVFCKQNEI
jgi:hypothetical protein